MFPIIIVKNKKHNIGIREGVKPTTSSLLVEST
jgi:hypothetical protein